MQMHCAISSQPCLHDPSWSLVGKTQDPSSPASRRVEETILDGISEWVAKGVRTKAD